MKGEAETENGPVDHFPAEPTEQAFTPARQRTVGLGHPQDAKKGRVAYCYSSFFITLRMKGLEPTRLRTRT